MPNYDGPEYRSAYEIRADSDDASDLTTITFARFDTWNEIYDYWEGRFLERLERGAFADTFDARGSSIKVLFNHGHDMSLGKRALGTPLNLREDEAGPTAEVQWIDRPYVDDIRAGIPPAVERSIYGASYMFKVEAETWDHAPERSDHNPDGIPERTISKVDVREFGLVTFAADEGTEELIGARSLTERFAPKTPSRESKKSEHPATAPGADLDTKRADAAMAYALTRRRSA